MALPRFALSIHSIPRTLALVSLTAVSAIAGCAAPQTGMARRAAPEAVAAAAGPQEYIPAAKIRPSDVVIASAPGAAVVVARPAAPAPRMRVAGDWAPPVEARRWLYIVVHHSATAAGNAGAFDREHREKGWDELGYHFVIGNGSGSSDGQIEVGPRWLKQKYGAHAKTPDERYNNFGIGVCLVGNFEDDRPSARQMEASAKLIAWLMETYQIPASRVIGHRDTKATACPGKFLNVAAIRSRAGQMITTAGGMMPIDPVASGELLRDTR